MQQRFTEHPNVVDLVFYRTVFRVMREHHVGAATAMRLIEEAQMPTLQQMWDQYSFNGPIIWVDEATFYGELNIKWRDD